MLLFILPTLTMAGQVHSDSIKSMANKKFDTYLTINASNICFYQYTQYSRGVQHPLEIDDAFSYKPSTIFNLQAKMFLSKNLAVFLQGGLLEKRFVSDIIINNVLDETLYYFHSVQAHSVNTISSVVGSLGLQRHFRLNDNIQSFVGIAFASKFDLKYKEYSEKTEMHQEDSTIIRWYQERTEVTTKGNQGIGYLLNTGIDIKLSNKFFLNTSIQYSQYKYFKNPVETSKVKNWDMLTSTTTDSEIIFDPKIPSASFLWPMTGGSNYFGRTDLTFTIGLTYKIK